MPTIWLALSKLLSRVPNFPVSGDCGHLLFSSLCYCGSPSVVAERLDTFVVLSVNAS